MDAAPNLFDLNAPAKETLASLALAGDWEAWRGALVLLAGIDLSAAAEKAGTEAGEFGHHQVQDPWLDLLGLRTECERTGAWLVKWLERNVDCRDGDGNPMKPYLVSSYGTRQQNVWVAVYRQYKVGD